MTVNLKRLFCVCCLLLSTAFLHAQNITGFREGDRALIRLLEKNLIFDNWEDSIPYRFTLAAVCFDSSGNIDTVKYSSEGYIGFKKEIYRVIQKTAGMWNKTAVRNQILVIPVELINYGKRDIESFQAQERMVSSEFIKMFSNDFAQRIIMIRPIILMLWGPHRKNAL